MSDQREPRVWAERFRAPALSVQVDFFTYLRAWQVITKSAGLRSCRGAPATRERDQPAVLGPPELSGAGPARSPGASGNARELQDVRFHLTEICALTGNLDHAVDAPDDPETPLVQPFDAIWQARLAPGSVVVCPYLIVMPGPTIQQLESIWLLAPGNASGFTGTLGFTRYRTVFAKERKRYDLGQRRQRFALRVSLSSDSGRSRIPS